MDVFLRTEAWVGLVTLVFLEIVLGVDNIIFISLATNKLPDHQQSLARRSGLALALVVRIVMLMFISHLVQFTRPLFEILEHSFSLRDIILSAGGLFLIGKSTHEMIHEVEDGDDVQPKPRKALSLRTVIVQIVIIDVVFSFDSILTAVGLTTMIPVMVLAVIISMFIIVFFSSTISNFMKRYPSLEVLALGFLTLIGFMLMLEGLHYEVPKGYIYFAVAFSLLVEWANLRVRRKRMMSKRGVNGVSVS